MIIRLVSWAALLALLSACAASPFPAQSARVNEGDYGRMGGYLQGNLGVAFENFDETGISVDDSATFNVRGGYRLHPYVATELLFEWLDEFDLGSGVSGEADGYGFSANAKVFLLTEQIQPYGLVGIGIMEATIDASFLGLPLVDEDETEITFRAGGGIDVYITEDVYLTGEFIYVWPTDDLKDFEYYTATGGIGFRF